LFRTALTSIINKKIKKNYNITGKIKRSDENGIFPQEGGNGGTIHAAAFRILYCIILSSIRFHFFATIDAHKTENASDAIMSSAAQRISKCLTNYSIEITPAAARKVGHKLADLLPQRTAVNVTYLVGANIDDSVAACGLLADAGMHPVAHVPARSFASLGNVEDYFSRLCDVGVEEVLVLGGGAPEPAGELTETMQILESGLLQAFGFAKVGVAAHPEGHPDIEESQLREVLVEKAAWAQRTGVDLYYETQFCFEANPVIEWEKTTREDLRRALGEAATLPSVRLGVAGPAKMSNLIRFGIMSGVGNSLQFLTKHSGNAMKLATTATPDAFIEGIADHREADANCLIEGLHLYPFGGFAKTAKWAEGLVVQ